MIYGKPDCGLALIDLQNNLTSKMEECEVQWILLIGAVQVDQQELQQNQNLIQGLVWKYQHQDHLMGQELGQKQQNQEHLMIMVQKCHWNQNDHEQWKKVKENQSQWYREHLKLHKEKQSHLSKKWKDEKQMHKEKQPHRKQCSWIRKQNGIKI